MQDKVSNLESRPMCMGMNEGKLIGDPSLSINLNGASVSVCLIVEDTQFFGGSRGASLTDGIYTGLYGNHIGT